MPEGDTIHRAARTLARALEGRRVLRAEGVEVSGAAIARVEARGKNLLIRFEDGRVLHTHMRMTGSWHVYRPGERWQRPRRQARAVLETDAFVAVCFNAPVVRLLSSRESERDPLLSRLGPDILSDDFDLGAAVAGLRARAELTVGEALLAQRALAGIGNVYKSETLFLCGVDPFRRVRELEDAVLRRLVAKAGELMRTNLTGPARTTTRPALDRRQRTWVYGRKGKGCRRCGTAIRMRRQGTAARSTYWCPSCQRSAVGADSAGRG